MNDPILMLEHQMVRSSPEDDTRQPLSVPTVQVGMGWFPEQPGGLNRYYYNLMNTLPQVGVTARGLITGSPNVAQQSEGRVTSFAPSSAFMPLRWRGARRAFAAELERTPDALVVSHFAVYGFPLLGQLKSMPLVVHFHGPWAYESQVERGLSPMLWMKRYIERAVYERAERVITLSQAFAHVVHSLYGVPMDRIRIVPGGVQADTFATGGSGATSVEEARRLMGWPEDRPTIVAVRRLVHRMGLEELIVAADEVRRVVPEVFFVIVGRGWLYEQLAEQIKARGLEQHVRLQGFLPDDLLPWAYRAATFSLVPTTSWEGFGLIVAESLAAGTPALVSPNGGLPEVVSDLSPDLVLPAATAPVIADVVTRALKGVFALPDAATCRQFAAERYDWSVVADQVREVYAEVV